MPECVRGEIQLEIGQLRERESFSIKKKGKNGEGQIYYIRW